MNSIEAYMAQFEEPKQAKLKELCHLIRLLVPPETSEKISWGMPTFFLNGNLVHFAMQKNHMGFYPGASGVEHFEAELDGYKHSKGAIQLPLDKPLPAGLIAKIVAFRVDENTRK